MADGVVCKLNISNDVPSSQQEKLVELLETHQVALVCRNCHRNYDNTTALLYHVQEGNCNPGAPTTEARADMVPKKRGRPRKTDAKLLPSLSPRSPAKKLKYEEDSEFVKVIPSSLTLGTPRRATRCSTGAIERKSVWDILGQKPRMSGDGKLEEEEEDDEEEEQDDEKPPVLQRGRGRPRKIKETSCVSSLSSTGGILPVAKRGPGRPRKNLICQPYNQPVEINTEGEKKQVSTSLDKSTAEKDSTKADEIQKEKENYVATSVGELTETGILNQNEGITNCHRARSPITKDANEGNSPSKADDGTKSDSVNMTEATNSLEVEDVNAHNSSVDSGQDKKCESEKAVEEDTQTFSPKSSDVNGAGCNIIEIKPVEAQKLPNNNKTSMDSEQNELDEENTVKDTSKDHQEGSMKSGTGVVRTSQYQKIAHQAGFYRPAGKRTSRDYKCPICKQRWFYTQEERELHVKCHNNAEAEIGYNCVSCDYKCTLWGRMLEHIASHEELKRKYMAARFFRNVVGHFPCPLCGKVFNKKVNMKGHVSKVHYKQNHVCANCGKTFEQVDDKTFQRHVEKCQNMIFQCEQCSYKTSVSMNLRKHIKIHDGTGFPCPICGTIFPTRQRCKVHELIHNVNRQKTMCEHCGKEFCSNDAVKRHVVRAHTEVLTYFKCTQCDFTAKLDTDLRKHVNSVHFKKFKCETCPYMSNSAEAFEQHKLYHDPNRRFACPYKTCFYRGLTSKQLSNHVSQVHRLTSRHQCPICQRMYKKKTHLVRHLVSHTEDKPYVCHECGEAYASHSLYYRHRRTTGHDKDRTSGASVPQNITIQYVTSDVNFDFEAETSEQAVAAENLAVQAVDGSIVQGEVQQAELVEEKVFQEITSDMISGEAFPQQVELQALEEIPQELVGDEKIITLEDENGQEVTYVLRLEDDQSVNVASETDNIVTIQPDEQTASIETDAMETSVVEAGELIHDVVTMDESQVGEVQAVVEVSPPGSDCQQYAILLLPQSEAENEAALSMLQLQPSDELSYAEDAEIEVDKE